MSWALELAERALAAAPPGDVMASVVGERSLTMRFAASRPTQPTAVEDVTVLVAVCRNGHVGSATTNLVTESGLADCGRAAAAAASAISGGAGAYPGFPAGGEVKEHIGFDAETALLDPAAGGAALEAAFSVCSERGVEAHGMWTAAEVVSAVASSAGARQMEHVTDVFMKVTAISPADGRSGYAAAAGSSLAALDAGALASRAASKVAPGAPLRLPPGDYPVVLEAEAVGELMEWLGYMAFNGQAFAEGRSALAGRLGERVASPRINLSDSPRFVRTLPRAFDAEGVPKAPMPLIQDGVAHSVVHDTRSAALAGDGAVSTGHAQAPGGSAWGPEPTNLVLIGGGARDEAELASRIDRGVYVTRLWYTNPVRENETLLTGVTRDGTFLIEDGVVTRPLEDMRFTDSVLGMLARCSDLGSVSRLTASGEFYGRRFASGVVCPPMRTTMRFTG